MKRTEARDMLIRVGADIIAQHGFNATGINTILSAAGIPKGSFYYYFASKEDFGLAVIETFAEEYDDKLRVIFDDTASAPLDRLHSFFRAGLADMSSCDCSRGCLIGNLGQELSAQNDAFRARLDQVFRGWERRLAACLEAARDAGDIEMNQDPQRLAGFILAGWEGAILRAKVTKTTQPMQSYVDLLFERMLAVA
ncbi:TetR/AcrR family transcriptional regulator [Modicisalibacter xianhensis]|nr:TetR/AcrR family transcriptional regulator [Halomonas xianhensis]